MESGRPPFSGLGGSFRVRVVVMRIRTVFSDSRSRVRVREDYAVIAAMSGWTLIMFMTRVRL